MCIRPLDMSAARVLLYVDAASDHHNRSSSRLYPHRVTVIPHDKLTSPWPKLGLHQMAKGAFHF